MKVSNITIECPNCKANLYIGEVIGVDFTDSPVYVCKICNYAEEIGGGVIREGKQLSEEEKKNELTCFVNWSKLYGYRKG